MRRRKARRKKESGEFEKRKGERRKESGQFKEEERTK